jgi:hypothetical protein
METTNEIIIKESDKLILEIDEKDPSHGSKHSDIVEKHAVQFLGPASALMLFICILCARCHDLWDRKIPGHADRRKRFIALIAGDPYAHVIEWIIDHIGVSKEAGPSYNQPKWTAARWREELNGLECGELGADGVLKIRHAVSAADMLTAVGKDGHTRTVIYNERKIREETGSYDIVELRKRVRAIHVAKHLRIIDWVHIDTPKMRELFGKGMCELVVEYNSWCAANGGTKEEMLS